MNFSLVLHGGAGTITRALMTSEKEQLYQSGLKDALNTGRKVLQYGGTALDAVCATVAVLEDNPLFNAGRGSVFNHQGRHEMDASVMDGSQLTGGAVTCVQNIRNPVLAARHVMEHSQHVLLCGAGAEMFAKEHGLEFADDDYFFDDFRFAQWKEVQHSETVQLDHTEKKFGTVGAVAVDIAGNLAAATSTGGMTNKKWGRIGDTPIIGAGTYANNTTCAVSCTGHGELFIRSVVAYDISCLMEYKGLSLQEACDLVVMEKLVKIGGEGGLVATDALGNVAMPFNSEGMYRAFCTPTDSEVLIYR
ncbi:MAG: isoaspartyl peptidase/L-asparaginase [Bacteroidetes bacterium]|nr:isoaspartyl peptidase/L-asparaginase [Bacteroidota bacterium]